MRRLLPHQLSCCLFTNECNSFAHTKMSLQMLNTSIWGTVKRQSISAQTGSLAWQQNVLRQFNSKYAASFQAVRPVLVEVEWDNLMDHFGCVCVTVQHYAHISERSPQVISEARLLKSRLDWAWVWVMSLGCVWYSGWLMSTFISIFVMSAAYNESLLNRTSL